MLFNPDGKGSIISKFGQTKIETYSITLDKYKQAVPKTVLEFENIYQILENRETQAPRFKALKIIKKPIEPMGKYALGFYYLIEDNNPTKIPAGDDYMLIETMGYFAVHPYIPNYLIRISYSHRYAIGNKDPEFNKKAKWVINQVTLSKK